MNYNLAQVNIGRILAPMDSVIMHDFAVNLDPINKLAEESPGFVWRLKDDSNNATSIKHFEDEFIIVNLSVWKDKDALFQYIYKTDHVDFFRRRKEWFEKMPEMHMALWFIPEGHTPAVVESVERLNYIRKHGATPFAFTFKKSFTAEEAAAFVPVV
jgi:hypothetical protein